MNWKKRALTGAPSPEESPREREGRALARRAAAEGIVLLKNEGALLPLPQGSRLALYGSGAGKTVKGGTGSGDVNERRSVSIWEGLEEAGFPVSSRRWLEEYDALHTQARLAWRDSLLGQLEGDSSNIFQLYASTPFPIPAGRAIDAQDVAEAGTDTAVYVVSRIAGEGQDRRLAPGDWFLSPEEERNLAATAAAFPHVILVLNAGGPIDLSILDRLPQIQAVLFLAQPGMEGGSALAQVLSGQVSPSGRLTDSWAYSYQDYPGAAAFSSLSGDNSREEYREGVYVGYRYFDAFDLPVRYPFGHGLSYTRFSQSLHGMEQQGDRIHVTVTVTNQGPRPGREVVQLYAACPQGQLPKERKRLCAFAKTQVLEPGAQEQASLSFPVEQLASFDEGAQAYVLEAGEYILLLGNDANHVQPVGVFSLNARTELRRVSPICPLQEPLEELSPDPAAQLRWAKALRDQCGGLPRLPLKPVVSPNRPLAWHNPLADQLASAMSREQLIPMAAGNPGRSQDSNLGAAGMSVPGSAGETCQGQWGEFTWPGIVLADGPAGLRLAQKYHLDEEGFPRSLGLFSAIEGGFFQPDSQEPQGPARYQYCTAFPVGTLLAQSWDRQLLEEVGKMVAREMEEFSVTLWLAPGMNIHRNPLCGRNFEYYSEDPLLTGVMAAAITQGVQSLPGVGTTIKHFACNNQEDNRMGSNSILSQRALREIYLHGFEIAVKSAQPMAIMTSYNLVNGVHSANSWDLCTRVAREEWGFQGLIMTDWTTTLPEGGSLPWRCIQAGNDLIMPGVPGDLEDISAALEDGRLPEGELRACVARILNIVLQSNQAENALPYLREAPCI